MVTADMWAMYKEMNLNDLQEVVLLKEKQLLLKTVWRKPKPEFVFLVRADNPVPYETLKEYYAAQQDKAQ